MQALISLFAAIIMLCPIAAQAQDYPDRTVKIVVPYPAGGGTDTVARSIAQRLSDAWRQPVVVENRPGAGTTIGAEAVAKATADGYTLLFSDTATFVINPYLYSRMTYDPFKDFAPITIVCHLVPVLAVANAIPAKTIEELLAYAKANPGKLSYASPGNGSYTHVAMEDFKKLAGADILHVPYKGTAQAMTDLLAGRVSMYMVTYSVFEAQEKAGKLKVVAAATEKRFGLRPDLPTIAESGVPGYSVNVWFALAAPAAVPAAILDKIHGDVVKILQDAEFREKVLKSQALEAGGNSRQDFAALLRKEGAHWARLVKATGAKLD